LPEPEPSPTAQIERIDALTAAGRTNWFGLMAYLVFAFITVLGVTDADFFIPSRQTQLPLVNVEIPTKSFFYFAPILAVALYAYLHLHIRKVTAALAAAPATVDGTPLERHIKPWLLNDLILRWRRDGSIDPMPMDWLATVTAVLLIWAAGPFVLAAIWVRSWPAHDEWMTTIAGLCLALSLYAGHASWFRMIGGLEAPSRLAALLRQARYVVTTALIAVAIPLVLVLGVIKTELGAVPDPLSRPWQDLRSQLSPRWQALWANGGEGLAGVPPLARVAATGAWAIVATPDWANELASTRLAETQFSVLPPDQNEPAAARHSYRANWCARNDLDPGVCGGSTVAGDDALAALDAARSDWCAERDYPEGTCAARFGELNQAFEEEWADYRTALIAGLEKPDLRGADLRSADLANSSITGVNLSRARIEGANLVRAQMEGADLARAKMQGAVLVGAQMEGADLARAQMQGADLRGAQMQGADLRGAQMQGAVLIEAEIEGADLTKAHLQKANLFGARLEGANLFMAKLDGANLFEAKLNGANLNEARLNGANLGRAQLEGAYLAGAHLEGTFLGWARLNGAEVWGARLTGAYLFGARLEGASVSGTGLDRADLSYSSLMGTTGSAVSFRSTNLSAAVNDGGALRFADLSGAILDAKTDFRNSFGDGTVTLPGGFFGDFGRPCQWAGDDEALSDEAFYARWRG
jgi:uncharacterized protein YjbI with pentapeptide repeats